MQLLSISTATPDNETRRIYGGQLMEENTTPFYVWLHKIETENDGCGGSLIDYKVVLTAAQCVYQNEPYQIQAVYGYNTISERSDRVNVGKIVVHEDFKPKLRSRPPRYNIAVLYLTKLVNVVYKINVIPRMDKSRSEFEGGALMVGYGAQAPLYFKTDIPSKYLQFGCVEVVPKTKCLGRAVSNVDGDVCYKAKGLRMGYGDAGGPLFAGVITKEGKAIEHYLLGVLSYQFGCGQGPVDLIANKTCYGTATSVPDMYDWIEAKINDKEKYGK